MQGYRMILGCGCEETWYEGDTFPGVGEMAECMGNDRTNCEKTGLAADETHGPQEIVEAWEEDF